MSEPVIRRAGLSDVLALRDIYNHFITNTHTTFHLDPLTFEQRLVWFEQFSDTGRHQCFVAMLGSQTLGWACSTPFKNRAAYDTSVETSVYLAPGVTGQGVGSRLYRVLLAALVEADVHRAYAFISEPNPASVRLHERMGFVRSGVLNEVGQKFGRFWDVAVFELRMSSEA